MAPANWNTREQIDQHKLATSIINGHGTDDDVFDDNELERLQRFVTDPSSHQVNKQTKAISEHHCTLI